jgi:isopenicillin N synthase-like dioxygenase
MPFLSSPIEFDKTPLANLKTIKFSQLVDGNEAVLKELTTACEHHGFFYLDLTDKGSGKMFRDLSKLRIIMKDWFAQPLSSKLKTESISLSHE